LKLYYQILYYFHQTAGNFFYHFYHQPPIPCDCVVNNSPSLNAECLYNVRQLIAIQHPAQSGRWTQSHQHICHCGQLLAWMQFNVISRTNVKCWLASYVLYTNLHPHKFRAPITACWLVVKQTNNYTARTLACHHACPRHSRMTIDYLFGCCTGIGDLHSALKLNPVM
jgi:hypothetical protein